MSSALGCDTLILLVGSNPLPNYVAARIIKPQKILMIHTSETEPVMVKLKSVFGQRLGCEVTPYPVRKSVAQDIRDAVSGRVTARTHLNYTGGTKVMAAQARMAFSEAFRDLDDAREEDRHASYVDEEKAMVLFDDGSKIPIAEQDLGLSLEDLAELHGVDARPTVGIEGGPTPQDVHKVVSCEVAGPESSKRRDLSDRGNRFKDKTVPQALPSQFEPKEFGLHLSVDKIPGDDWSDERLRLWEKFLTNGWLELWVAGLVEKVTGTTPQWSVNCMLQPKFSGCSERKFEIDVALLRGHRLHIISCTTASHEGECKLKLFEVGYRARQLGGDLARAALISFLDGINSETRKTKVETVQQDVQSLWDAPNEPKVFGLADIREWFGYNGNPNLETLRQWLDCKGGR